MVAEYTVDELAEDSNDEKRLEKAEQVAERKACETKESTRTSPKAIWETPTRPTSAIHWPGDYCAHTRSITETSTGDTAASEAGRPMFRTWPDGAFEELLPKNSW